LEALNDTNPLRTYASYFNAISKQCEGEMLQKGESRLGGAQAFMSTHCIALTQSGRVDPTASTVPEYWLRLVSEL
jgi:hypothetical protein